MIKHLLFILILLGGSYYYWTTRPVVHGPGVVAPKKPVQEDLLRYKEIEHKGFELNALAKFTIEARVLSKKRYSDTMAKLAPFDFMMGWGPMSDERNLDYILIKQSDRSFDWEMTKPPIPQREMYFHSSNMHMIPSTITIRDKMNEVRRGNTIRVKGFLVEASSSDGWKLKSSLSRKDIGEKAAELVWVEEFVILK